MRDAIARPCAPDRRADRVGRRDCPPPASGSGRGDASRRDRPYRLRHAAAGGRRRPGDKPVQSLSAVKRGDAHAYPRLGQARVHLPFRRRK